MLKKMILILIISMSICKNLEANYFEKWYTERISHLSIDNQLLVALYFQCNSFPGKIENKMGKKDHANLLKLFKEGLFAEPIKYDKNEFREKSKKIMSKITDQVIENISREIYEKETYSKNFTEDFEVFYRKYNNLQKNQLLIFSKCMTIYSKSLENKELSLMLMSQDLRSLLKHFVQICANHKISILRLWKIVQNYRLTGKVKSSYTSKFEFLEK